MACQAREVAVAGDQERHHGVETDLYPGRPPRVASRDPRPLVDRRRYAANHRGHRHAPPHRDAAGEQPRRLARPGPGRAARGSGGPSRRCHTAYLRALLTSSDGRRIGQRIAVITGADAQNPQCSGADRISRLAALITELNASEHAAVFAGPTTLEPELLAAGNDAAVWTAWAAQQPRAWETAKAAIEAAGPGGRAAAFAIKLKDAGLRKGDFAQDFLEAVEAAGMPLRLPAYLENALRWLTADPIPVQGHERTRPRGRPCTGARSPASGDHRRPAVCRDRLPRRRQDTGDRRPAPRPGRAGPQGRAITAFTRVAVTEVHRRCVAAGRFDLTGRPHFIGTLDTFL